MPRKVFMAFTGHFSRFWRGFVLWAGVAVRATGRMGARGLGRNVIFLLIYEQKCDIIKIHGDEGRKKMRRIPAWGHGA